VVITHLILIMKLFDKFIHWYVKRRLQHIADNIPVLDIKELIKYHDYMAIQCLDKDTKGSDRVMGMSVQTACALETIENPNYHFEVAK